MRDPARVLIEQTVDNLENPAPRIKVHEICPDCGKHFEVGDWPFGCAGLGHQVGPFWLGDAEVHTSEKTYADVHPVTGDQKIPGRFDRPMNAKLSAAGYERRELRLSEVRQLEKKGLVSEKLNYNSNGSAEKALGQD